ncbi:unnamed protein product [Brassica rapa subsp. narinosa]
MCFFFSSRGDERTYRRRRRRSILPPENVETPERDGRDDVGEKKASFERERKRLVLTVLTNSLEVAEPEEGAVDERLPSRLFVTDRYPSKRHNCNSSLEYLLLV